MTAAEDLRHENGIHVWASGVDDADQTLGRRSVLPNWPAIMRPDTAGAYLDCVGTDGRTRGRFAEWKKKPGFPQPDPETGMYYKLAIDAFLEEYFGYADPVEASERNLDRMFGT